MRTRGNRDLMTGSALTLSQVPHPGDSNRVSKVCNSTVQTETEASYEEPKSKVCLGLSLVLLVHLHFILRKHERVEKAKGSVPRISKAGHTGGMCTVATRRSDKSTKHKPHTS